MRGLIVPLLAVSLLASGCSKRSPGVNSGASAATPAAASAPSSSSEGGALTPDLPRNFGYKCTWLAIRATNSRAVATALGLSRIEPITWAKGVGAAYDGRVFVSPPVRGWVLVVQFALPSPGDANTPDEATPFLVKVGSRFPEVQYFASHRVVGYSAWARLIDGSFKRKFAYSGEQGVVAWNEGTDTEAERDLGLELSAPLDVWQTFPDEDSVMAVARNWSVDPSTLESQGLRPGLGLVGDWP